MAVPIEDNFEDIIAKAQRGLGLSDAQLADRASLEPETLRALKAGTFDAAALRSVAGPLQLSGEALVQLGAKSYHPAPIAVAGLAMFNTPYEDMAVNAYLAWDPATKLGVAFDTGADVSPMLEKAEAEGVKIELILLTHTHGDHIFDLDRLKEKTGAVAYVSEREPLEGAEPFAGGRNFQVGGLDIESRLTWGHSKGGTTFVIAGLERPVAIVGDSIFAGSMGGGKVSYEEALKNNREQILTLSEDTVICPGHGPLTTVGEQQRHNPFFA